MQLLKNEANTILCARNIAQLKLSKWLRFFTFRFPQSKIFF